MCRARVTCYTDSVANLTLSIEHNLLREARKLALDRKTSVNQMVREFLREQVHDKDEHAAKVARLESLFGTVDLGLGPEGITWTRDELYNRPGPKFS